MSLPFFSHLYVRIKKLQKVLTILPICNIIIIPHCKGSERLLELLKTEGFENVYEVDQFQKEFAKITKKNRRYYDWLRAKLAMLEKKGMEALKMESFETLPYTNPKLYSIRYPHSRLNPRVIYVYANRNEIYLLTAFKESSKKGNSDYDSAIKVANDRLKYIEEYY